MTKPVADLTRFHYRVVDKQDIALWNHNPQVASEISYWFAWVWAYSSVSVKYAILSRKQSLAKNGLNIKRKFRRKKKIRNQEIICVNRKSCYISVFYIFIPDTYNLWGLFELNLLPELLVHLCPCDYVRFSRRLNSCLLRSHHSLNFLHTSSALCSALLSATFTRSLKLI